jgi:hypothetical protein
VIFLVQVWRRRISYLDGRWHPAYLLVHLKAGLDIFHPEAGDSAQLLAVQAKNSVQSFTNIDMSKAFIYYQPQWTISSRADQGAGSFTINQSNHLACNTSRPLVYLSSTNLPLAHIRTFLGRPLSQWAAIDGRSFSGAKTCHWQTTFTSRTLNRFLHLT